MKCNCFSASRVAVVSLGLLVAGAGSIVIAADPPKDSKPAAAQPEFKLPPGWTEADMQACMAAGTPGKMQELLVKGAGVWLGKNTMWMGPDGPAMKSEMTTTVTPIMDGRYVHVEVRGDMPGMGPYTGAGVYGYDNVAQKFVGNWIDNHSTGIMTGTGALSADGKVMTWNYTYQCPLTKKSAIMREVQTITGPNTKTMEMFGVEPKSGKEYKMMSVEMTKK